MELYMSIYFPLHPRSEYHTFTKGFWNLFRGFHLEPSVLQGFAQENPPVRFYLLFSMSFCMFVF